VDTRNIQEFKLTKVTIRICPACGVVNPAGPSGGCPHLQLVRFDGVDHFLENLLNDIAKARRSYLELQAILKKSVKDAVSNGTAFVETPHNVNAQEAASLYSKAGKTPPLILTPSKTRQKKKIKTECERG
jgi:hypothetical protein